MRSKKILYCDLDSTLNNHWIRIQKWALPEYPGNSIHQNAFTRNEILKDTPLPNSIKALDFFSKSYKVNILTARNFRDAYSITKEWLDLHKFRYDSIKIVKSAMHKVYFLNPFFFFKRRCDLLIDDFSKGQEYSESYVNIYDNVIEKLDEKNIKYEIFKNNWDEILKKYEY